MIRTDLCKLLVYETGVNHPANVKKKMVTGCEFEPHPSISPAATIVGFRDRKEFFEKGPNFGAREEIYTKIFAVSRRLKIGNMPNSEEFFRQAKPV